MKKKGKITPNGVVLKTYENATVVFLTEQGIDIDLIPTSNAEGVHTPDIKMNGLEWEMKAPLGAGKQLVENTIQRALRESKLSQKVEKPLILRSKWGIILVNEGRTCSVICGTPPSFFPPSYLIKP